MTVRVLVVDDHESWRRYFTSAIQGQPDCQVIGEAADGLDAVQKAEQLRPDLILLDVGLPGLNGIEAARRIRRSLPHTRILFVTEQRSPEIAAVALKTGATGYVIKSDAARELAAAVGAILGGRAFVSARLAGSLGEDHGIVPGGRHHEATLCESESAVLDSFADFAATALKAGNAAIVVVTGAHAPAIRQRLRAAGVGIDRAIEEERYLSVDVDALLSTFVLNGVVDRAAMRKAAAALVVSAARTHMGAHRHVAACGECAPMLLTRGYASAAMEVEGVWDEIARTHDVTILCGYSLTVPPYDREHPIVRQIHDDHSAVHYR